MYAVVFPGQGSQAVGMAMDFAERFPESRSVLDEADAAFEGPLSRWLAEGPEEQLRRTEITQPAILTASIAIWRALEPRLSQAPVCVAGHSLGEYSALVAAGALDFFDAVRLVRRRGAFMQEAVPEGEGAMAAVMGLDGPVIEQACAAIDGPVGPANYNSPAQTVIAGSAALVEQAGEALQAAGARRVVPLDVSAPFHCELMAPARDRLANVLAETGFKDAHTPVISNVDAKPYTDADTARQRLREQVCAPVRWVDCVRSLVAMGAQLELEVGPGRVLSGLAPRIDRSLRCVNVAKVGDVDAALASIVETGT